MKTKINLILIFLTLSSLLRAGGSQDSGPAAVPGYTGVVEYLEGTVTMDGTLLEIGDRVKSGSTFETSADSYCEIVFGGKNIFRIRENTLAVITLEQGKGEMDLEKGSMAFFLEKLSVLDEGASDFEVKTPSAAMGVRGTAFFVNVESAASTYICACNGTLQIENAEGGQQAALSGTHHKAVRITRNSGGDYTASPEGMLYHNDGDLDSLAERIGSRIPWDTLKSAGSY